MRIRIIWALVLSLALGAAAQAASVRAQVTIGVSPSLVEMAGKAGGTGEVDLTILNRGEEAFDVAITSQPYNRVEPEFSAQDWLSADQETAHVEAASQAIVTITVTIPEDADSGGRYAAVAITTIAGEVGGNTSSISGELLVPILITVDGKGKIERKAKIERFAAVLELDGRLGFRSEVSNGGNIHWESAGTATVTKGDGSDYGTLDIEQAKVYPQGARTLVTTSTLPVESGGNYKAKTEIAYGANDPITAETEFTFTSELSITGNACENLDRGPTMSASMVNGGDLGVISNVNLRISTADGQPFGETGIIGPNIVWPGETAVVGADLPERLQTGDYLLTVQAQTGASADPVITEIPFSIGGTGPNVAPICEQPASTPAAD